MSQKKPQPKKVKPVKRTPIILILGVLVGLGVLLAAAGFAFAATQEQSDAFCASCHTQPESTFFARSTAAQPVDMASFHTGKQIHCIDCHSGDGVVARVQAEILGARNAALWYTGAATQPAKLTAPIGDGNCLKCHAAVTQRGYTPKEQLFNTSRDDREAGNGHWHQFLLRWQVTDPTNAGTCVSCHNGHIPDSNAQSGFMDVTAVNAECDSCHQVLRQGD